MKFFKNKIIYLLPLICMLLLGNELTLRANAAASDIEKKYNLYWTNYTGSGSNIVDMINTVNISFKAKEYQYTDEDDSSSWYYSNASIVIAPYDTDILINKGIMKSINSISIYLGNYLDMENPVVTITPEQLKNGYTYNIKKDDCETDGEYYSFDCVGFAINGEVGDQLKQDGFTTIISAWQPLFQDKKIAFDFSNPTIESEKANRTNSDPVVIDGKLYYLSDVRIIVEDDTHVDKVYVDDVLKDDMEDNEFLIWTDGGSKEVKVTVYDYFGNKAEEIIRIHNDGMDYNISYKDGSQSKNTTINSYPIRKEDGTSDWINTFKWKDSVKFKAQSSDKVSKIAWMGVYRRADGTRVKTSSIGSNFANDSNPDFVCYKGEDANKEIELTEDGVYYIYSIDEVSYQSELNYLMEKEYISTVEEYEERLKNYTINGTVDDSRVHILIDKAGAEFYAKNAVTGEIYNDIDEKTFNSDIYVYINGVLSNYDYDGFDMTYITPDNKKIKKNIIDWNFAGLIINRFLTADCAQNGTYIIEYTDPLGRTLKESFKLDKKGPAVKGIVNGEWYDSPSVFGDNKDKAISYSVEGATKITLTVFKKAGDYNKEYGEMEIDYTLDLPAKGTLNQNKHGLGVYLLTAEDASGNKTEAMFRWGDMSSIDTADKVTVTATSSDTDTSGNNNNGGQNGTNNTSNNSNTNNNGSSASNANNSNGNTSSGTTTIKPADKGKALTVSGAKATFTVTSSDAANPTVAFSGITDKKAKSVTIPEKITVDNVTYKVTSVADKALSGNKKIKKVTIPKGVTSIGKNAFNNCKNLKNIVIKSTTLKSVGKNAIKGINKKAVIKAPKKQLKAYKKLFAKKTGYKKTMKIKK